MCRRRILIVFWIVSTMLNPHFSVCGWMSEEAWGEEPTLSREKSFARPLWGKNIYVPPRDRPPVSRPSVSYSGTSQRAEPDGSTSENWDDDNRRLYEDVFGVVNDVDYTIGLRDYPNWSLPVHLGQLHPFPWDALNMSRGRARGTELEMELCLRRRRAGVSPAGAPVRQDRCRQYFRLPMRPGIGGSRVPVTRRPTMESQGYL